MKLVAFFRDKLLQSPQMKSVWWIVPLLLLATVILGWRLGEGQLRNYDEGIYAVIAAEMAESDDYFNLTYAQENWFEKPPLMIWLTAISYELLGQTTLSTRLWPFFFSVGSVGLVFLIGRRLKHTWVGILAGLILLTLPQFLHNGRTLMMDQPLIFFSLAGVWGLVRFHFFERKFTPLSWKPTLIIGLFIALAILSKGPAVSYYAIGILLTTLTLPDLNARLISLVKIAGVAISIALPWYLTQWFVHGYAFIGEHFGYHIVERASRNIESHTEPNSYLFQVHYWGGFPWIWLTPLAVAWAGFRSFWAAKDSQIRLPMFLYLGAWIPPLVMTTNLGQYMVPTLPVLALLLAHTAWDLYQYLRPRLKFAGLVWMVPLGIILSRLHLPLPLDCASPFTYRMTQWQLQANLMIEEDLTLFPGAYFYLRDEPRHSWKAIQRALQERPNTIAMVSPMSLQGVDFAEQGLFPYIATSEARVVGNRAPIQADTNNENDTYSATMIQRVCYPYMPSTLDVDPLVY